MKFIAEPRQTVGTEIVEDEIRRQFSMRDFTPPKFKKVKNCLAFDMPEKDEDYLRTAIDVNVGAFLVGEVSEKEKLKSLAKDGKSLEKDLVMA